MTDNESCPFCGLPTVGGYHEIHETPACIARQLAKANAENDRLQAIVDKLPKTADGVPVAPGMTVYFCRDGSPHIVGAFHEWSSDPDEYEVGDAVPCWNEEKRYSARCLGDCYSTRKAAEAAINGGRQR